MTKKGKNFCQSKPYVVVYQEPEATDDPWNQWNITGETPRLILVEMEHQTDFVYSVQKTVEI